MAIEVTDARQNILECRRRRGNEVEKMRFPDSETMVAFVNENKGLWDFYTMRHLGGLRLISNGDL